MEVDRLRVKAWQVFRGSGQNLAALLKFRVSGFGRWPRPQNIFVLAMGPKRYPLFWETLFMKSADHGDFFHVAKAPHLLPETARAAAYCLTLFRPGYPGQQIRVSHLRVVCEEARSSEWWTDTQSPLRPGLPPCQQTTEELKTKLNRDLQSPTKNSVCA